MRETRKAGDPCVSRVYGGLGGLFLQSTVRQGFEVLGKRMRLEWCMSCKKSPPSPHTLYTHVMRALTASTLLCFLPSRGLSNSPVVNVEASFVKTRRTSARPETLRPRGGARRAKVRCRDGGTLAVKARLCVTCVC